MVNDERFLNSLKIFLETLEMICVSKAILEIFLGSLGRCVCIQGECLDNIQLNAGGL